MRDVLFGIILGIGGILAYQHRDKIVEEAKGVVEGFNEAVAEARSKVTTPQEEISK